MRGGVKDLDLLAKVVFPTKDFSFIEGLDDSFTQGAKAQNILGEGIAVSSSQRSNFVE